MIKKSPFNQDEVIVSISDLWKTCKRQKSKILYSAIVGMALAALFSLRAPIRYEATGTFKEGQQSSSLLESKFQALIGMRDDGGNTSGTMRSRMIMEPVVKHLGLQATLVEPGLGGFFNTMLQNIKVSRAYDKYATKVRPSGGVLSGKVLIPTEAVIPDQTLGIVCQEVQYSGEYFIPLDMRFVEEDKYRLTRSGKELIGEFHLGQVVQTREFSFIINRDASSRLLEGKRFRLCILPLSSVANSLIEDVKITKDKTNKKILKISYINRNRHLAAEVVNELMYAYKRYLKDEFQRTVRSQLSYLENRQNETTSALEKLVGTHAQYLQDHLGHGGFVDLDKEMEFVSKRQAEWQTRLMEIELELKQLETADRENGYFVLQSIKYNDVVKDTARTLCDLRQQRDNLTLALNEQYNESDEELKSNLINKMDRFADLERQLEEVQQLSIIVQNTEFLPEEVSQKANYLPIVKVWCNRLVEERDSLSKSANDHDKRIREHSLNACRRNFSEFLENLEKQLKMNVTIIKEHITRQEGGELNIHGLDLATSRALYLEYNNKLEVVESEVLQLEYVMNQMEDPDFELSALSTILIDAVASDTLKDASRLLRQLNDEKNRSQREQNRLRDELGLTKSYLLQHLQQSKSILELRQNLLKEKIQSIQNITLDLVYQNISVIEDQFAQLILKTQKHLKSERELIKKELFNLSRKMSHLPEKWLSEQSIDLRTKMSLKVVEELANLVEAKNISHDMNQVECHPLDVALAATLPIRPHLLLFSLIGAAGGALACVFVLFIQTSRRGLEATEGNLEQAGQKILGSVSGTGSICSISTYPDDQQNLATVRQIIASLAIKDEEGPQRSSVVVLLEGKGPDYSPLLCKFLALRGEKVLRVDCNFKRPPPSGSVGEKPGLLQHLHHPKESIQFNHVCGYDFVNAGGTSEQGVELLGSKNFDQFLKEQKTKYDRIILATPYSVAEPGVAGIAQLGNQTVVTLSDELISHLKPLLELNASEPLHIHSVAYLLYKLM